MKLEKHIQKDILDYLKSENIYAIKTIKNNRNGVLDVIGCDEGKFFSIEVKREGEDATPLQLHHIKKIRESGGIAGVCRSVEDVKKLLKGVISD